MAFDYQSVTIEGLRMRVGTTGSAKGAPPLLLLNGIGFNAELMEPLARALPGRAIVCPDMPGAGGSSNAAIPYRMSRVARACTKLMNNLHPGERFDCLGLSWGGALAQQIAVQSPSALDRLVLVATYSGLPLPAGDLEVFKRLFDPREYFNPHILAENLHALLREGGASAGLMRRFSTPTPLGIAYQITALLGWTAAPLLPFVRNPMLLITIRDDTIVPIAHHRALACLASEAETHEVRIGGHLAPLASPQSIAPRVREFLGEGSQRVAA